MNPFRMIVQSSPLITKTIKPSIKFFFHTVQAPLTVTHFYNTQYPYPSILKF